MMRFSSGKLRIATSVRPQAGAVSDESGRGEIRGRRFFSREVPRLDLEALTSEIVLSTLHLDWPTANIRGFGEASGGGGSAQGCPLPIQTYTPHSSVALAQPFGRGCRVSYDVDVPSPHGDQTG